MEYRALSILHLLLVLVLVRSGVGEGIEKVSYLLQYGPGVHTVFEQQNEPDKKPPVNVRDRVAPPAPTMTLTSKLPTKPAITLKPMDSVISEATGQTQLAHAQLNTNAGVYQSSSTVTTSDFATTEITNGAGPLTNEGVASATLSTPSGLVTSKDPTYHSTATQGKRPFDLGALASVTQQHSSSVGVKCGTPLAILRMPHPLPLPPILPTFSSMLRSDVVVNLKTKELRTLMSTYIELIETYKNFNLQQKKNIAHLEEELARQELGLDRAKELNNAKLIFVK